MPNGQIHGLPPDDYSGPKRSLVLSGGGMRLSYQAGALRALLESGLVFHHIDGTSGGSLTMSMLLAGQSPVEICDRWRGLNVWDSVSMRPIKDYLRHDDLIALSSGEGLRDKVLPSLGIDVNRIRKAQGIVGTYNVLDYAEKSVNVIPHEEIDADMIVAGVCLPGVLPPVRRNDNSYLDCAFVQDANLLEAVRRGAQELWVVWGLGNTSVYQGGLLNLYVQMLEMSANGALRNELRRIQEINQQIENGETVWGHSEPIRVHVIHPKYPLPLDPDLYLGKIDNATLIDMGYADASAYLATGLTGLPIDLDVTVQKNPRPGITFREMMAGGFSMGETDTAVGAKKGADTVLAMHATINIDDIDRFVSDPDHPGGITGRIDYPSFGQNIPAKRGVFNLFSPADQPNLKLMVYELGFEHDGQDYYMAGKKEVRHDQTLDLWSDTTTLYTQLHRGTDKSGEVVGAGILSLGVMDLAKLMKTFHATNTTSVAESTRAISKFASFFLGELYDSYLKPKKPWWKFWE